MPLWLWRKQDQFYFDREIAEGQEHHWQTHNSTSGVRCEFYNASLKNSPMNSSHIPDSYGLGQTVDISCTTSKYRYELVQVVQKFFNRIGISGGSYGGFVHLDVDKEKVQEVMWVY